MAIGLPTQITMRFPRSSGVLLHPTSLPGAYGVGDLGPHARRFVDFLEDAGQSLWQVLPLNPPGYGESPYQCYSAIAGNPLLIRVLSAVLPLPGITHMYTADPQITERLWERNVTFFRQHLGGPK